MANAEPPRPARELVDMDWLYQVQDRHGKSFEFFCVENAQEKEKLLKFSFTAQPSDPTLKDLDNSTTVAYIARAVYLHAKATGYHTKVKGIVAWTLKSKGLNSTMVERVAPAFVSDFQEEAESWEAISDGLHERLWTGRGEMRRMNRGEG